MVKVPISYEESRKTREVAVERCDGLPYFESCKNLGINPEFPDLSERGEAESLVKEKGLANVIKSPPKVFKSVLGKYKGRETRRDRTVDGRTRDEDPRFDYNRFKQTVEAGDYSISVFKHTDSKRQLLKECGLAVLTGLDGVPISIGDLEPEKIGSIFKDYYGRSVRYHRESLQVA